MAESRYKRLSGDLPLIIGHRGQITDLAFSPHYDNVLATSSNDGCAKVWVVPEQGGLLSDMHEGEEYASLVGHNDAVSLVAWNPTAAFTLATSSHD